MAIPINEYLAEPIFLDVVSSREHPLHQRAFDLAQHFTTSLNLVSTANIQANDLLLIIRGNPTLNHGLLFFPRNLVCEYVLFVLFHVSV